MPGGPPLPSTSTAVHAVHGGVRLGYYAVSRTYREQGEYNATYTFADLRRSLIYVFADVDIEAISSASQNFQPDRQTGTFEIGARHLLGGRSIGLFLRHQSSHNIDRSDRRLGSWEVAGVRWIQPLSHGTLQLSAGPYIHTTVVDYHWDLDARFTSATTSFLSHRWQLAADLHPVLEGGVRTGFVDFWVEPELVVSPHLNAYLGTGQIHDIQVFLGRTETPVMVGLKILF